MNVIDAFNSYAGMLFLILSVVFAVWVIKKFFDGWKS